MLVSDGSEDAQVAARTATDLANGTDSELHVVTVGLLIPMPLAYARANQRYVEQETRKLLDKQAEKVRSFGGTVTQTYLGLGDPAAEIVALADELGAGLIVVGSRGLDGLRRALLGSVSDSVVRHAHCPVMVVRKEEGRHRGAPSLADQEQGRV